MDVYRLSGAAQRVIEAASTEARALAHARLDAAHLLLGLVAEKGAAAVVLGRLGVDAQRLRQATDAVYEGARGGRSRDLDRTSGEAKEVLELARDEADAAGEHDILPARIFLAATHDDEWSANVALRQLGVDVEKARAEVASLARDEAQGSLPG